MAISDIGLAADIGSLNRYCGQAVVALAQALDNCAGIAEMLNNADRGYAVAGTVDPLVVAGMGTADAANFRSAFDSLYTLQQISVGDVAQSGASPVDYFYIAQTLMGTTPL